MDFFNQPAQSFGHQPNPASQASAPPYQGQPQGQAYYPPQGANNGLPPDWIQEWDAQDNRYFYINQRTGERTFNRPSANPSDPNHNLPPGWIAEWDAPDRRWFFVNQRTGERTWNHPGGPPPVQYTEVHSSGPGYQQTEVVTQAPQQKNHNLAYGAGGAVAGLAAGALLMHEGHKVEEHWEEDKEKFENDFEGGRDYRNEEYRGYGGDGNTNVYQNETIVNDDRYGGGEDYSRTSVVRDDGYGDDGYRRDEYRDDSYVDDAARWTGNKVQEVEDLPEDAARWTGNKVQEVEDILEDAARWTGEKVQEVEDIPEDIAGWAGNKVQGVEDFSENVEGSYDQGRDDRY